MDQSLAGDQSAAGAPADKEAGPARLRHALPRHFGASSSPDSSGERASSVAVVARAPGRVNLLGGHTDYSGGFVLPTTIDRAVHVALRRGRDEERVRLRSSDFDESATFALADVEENTAMDALPTWARYVAGVAIELRRRGYELEGFDAVIEGDVPLGAGLSSSAALEVGTAIGLDGLFSLRLEATQTAKLCQRAEQEHVGVECGIMDQFASRVGQAGHALFLDCRSLGYRHVPLPLAGEVCLVVADSGVRRELASSKYNERRRECEKAARFFRERADDAEEKQKGHTLRNVSEEQLASARGGKLSETLFRRARHVVSENERVEHGATLLADGDLEAFGQLMDASHASLAEDYEVSCAELDALVEIAQSVEGVLGTRMTGAGFGGCTVTLARRGAAGRLQRALQTRYRERFARDLETYLVERNFEAELL